MIAIEKVSTDEQLSEVHRIREIVFIEEQDVPRDREYDEFENVSTHFLLRYDGIPVGCGRLRPRGDYVKLERIAVLEDFRGKGLGKEIMRALEEEAVTHSPSELVLHSQVSAMGFYRSCGYRERGEIFLDAGIDHMEMSKEVSD